MGEAAVAESKSGFSSGVVAIPLPRVFGRLLLLRLLARGGMGDVYLAATTGIEGAERPCVVKTVRRDHIHDGSFLARFLDEARVQAQLNHPGVVQVIEAANDDNGEPYNVVEHVEGRSLSDVRQRAVQLGVRIGWVEAAAMIIEMGQALAHVHERASADGTPLGIVHRDLSPQNVMIGYAGELKLIDFGTARGQNRRCHTVAGVVFAKPGYVAPEVARQQVGDSRIDLYAMGVMLWELCAGKRLLSGDPQKHLQEVAEGRFAIPALAPIRAIPVELDDVIARLCANDPDDRYTTAHGAVADLSKILSATPASKSGERGVRARIAGLMRSLWPDEPGRSRAEFARLLAQARALKTDTETPSGGMAMEAARAHMTDDPSMLSGTPYRLLSKIGEGASGQVYEAEHVELGRRVAVKVMAPVYASAHDAIDRFRREARVIATLSHPSLAFLYDFGKSLDGRVFIAMELLSGHTLDKRPRRILPYKQAIDLAIATTHALECAHAAGVVHRDLKPQNLFLTDKNVLKLLDFGVAMADSEISGEKRQKGFCIFGTPEFMAPEQVAGETVDHRCDIYALGCVLYELVTGAPPFEGESSVVVMGKQLRETPEAPRRRVASIPQEVEAVILRALAKKPEDRFADVKAMREALQLARTTPDQRRRRARSAVTAVAALSCAILALAGYKSAHRAANTEIPTVAVESLPLAAPTLAENATPPPGTIQAAPAGPEENVTAPAATIANAATPAAPESTTATATAAEARAEPPVMKVSMREGTLAARLSEARERAKTHDDARSIRAWALAAYRAGAHAEAIGAAERWSARDAGSDPRMLHALALDASGRKQEAKALLEEWVRSHPNAHDARRVLARINGTGETTRKSASAKSR